MGAQPKHAQENPASAKALACAESSLPAPTSRVQTRLNVSLAHSHASWQDTRTTWAAAPLPTTASATPFCTDSGWALSERPVDFQALLLEGTDFHKAKGFISQIAVVI